MVQYGSENLEASVIAFRTRLLRRAFMLLFCYPCYKRLQSPRVAIFVMCAHIHSAAGPFEFCRVGYTCTAYNRTPWILYMSHLPQYLTTRPFGVDRTDTDGVLSVYPKICAEAAFAFHQQPDLIRSCSLSGVHPRKPQTRTRSRAHAAFLSPSFVRKAAAGLVTVGGECPSDAGQARVADSGPKYAWHGERQRVAKSMPSRLGTAHLNSGVGGPNRS